MDFVTLVPISVDRNLSTKRPLISGKLKNEKLKTIDLKSLKANNEAVAIFVVNLENTCPNTVSSKRAVRF